VTRNLSDGQFGHLKRAINKVTPATIASGALVSGGLGSAVHALGATSRTINPGSGMLQMGLGAAAFAIGATGIPRVIGTEIKKSNERRAEKRYNKTADFGDQYDSEGNYEGPGAAPYVQKDPPEADA
jgi:hypothetical protein